MKMNMNNWFADVKQSSKRLAMPIMTHPGITLIGETVYNAVTNGHVHFNAVEAISKKYPCAASTVIMDLTVEAEAFGSEITFSTHDVPTITGRLVAGPESAEFLAIPDLNQGRVRQYLKAAHLAAENISGIPVLAGCIGPLSLAGRLYDMTELMTAIYLNPQEIHILIEKCSTFISEYILAFKNEGCNGVIMAEPAAGLLPEDMCDLFSSAYIKKIIEKVQDTEFIVILHNCGNTGHLTSSMLSTGAAGLHFGNKLDIIKALEVLPESTLVFGNLDPVGIFKLSTPESVYEITLNLLKRTASYRNFIISSGCDVPPGVSFENIDSFFQAISDYNITNHKN